LIRSQVTEDFVTKLAVEHRRGRRLYVGTTNLDTRRFVVWDLGALACLPIEKAAPLIRDILLASASVPGVFPPVAVEVEVDGKKFKELHCDGGATSPIFVPSAVFAVAEKQRASITGQAPESTGSLYVIIAGKCYPDAEAVRQRVLPVLGATANALLYANTRAELTNLYSLSRSSGMDFHAMSLRQDFLTLDDSLSFKKSEQTRLLAEGIRLGASREGWRSIPPEIMPGDGDYIRTGVKLRSVPTPQEPDPANNSVSR
jgi:predicted acylesterase/phospholipase RssA